MLLRELPDHLSGEDCQEGKKVVEELAALRCACGHGLFVALRDTAERVGYVVFFDNEPTSETYSKRVRECPACGVVIGLHTLIPANPST